MASRLSTALGLVPARTRRAVREYLSAHSTLGQIDDLFADEGLVRQLEGAREVGGQRRGLVEEYYAAIDWTDPSAVEPVIRVFESVLEHARANQYGPQAYEQLSRQLEQDGFSIDQRGRIRRPRALANLSSAALEVLPERGTIEDHLSRMADSVDRDPALAISQAKAVVEAVAKLVLQELGHKHSPAADMPSLVRQAQKALGLHPESVAPTAKGAGIVKKLLGGLSAVAIGLTELRNEYGPDHGRAEQVVLAPRHARLACGAAEVYCRALLDTLTAVDAPWRRDGGG